MGHGPQIKAFHSVEFPDGGCSWITRNNGTGGDYSLVLLANKCQKQRVQNDEMKEEWEQTKRAKGLPPQVCSHD